MCVNIYNKCHEHFKLFKRLKPPKQSKWDVELIEKIILLLLFEKAADKSRISLTTVGSFCVTDFIMNEKQYQEFIYNNRKKYLDLFD